VLPGRQQVSGRPPAPLPGSTSLDNARRPSARSRRAPAPRSDTPAAAIPAAIMPDRRRHRPPPRLPRRPVRPRAEHVPDRASLSWAATEAESRPYRPRNSRPTRQGAVTVASTPADLDWLASEMETGGTVVVVTPRITSACGPSCGDSNGAWSRRLLRVRHLRRRLGLSGLCALADRGGRPHRHAARPEVSGSPPVERPKPVRSHALRAVATPDPRHQENHHATHPHRRDQDPLHLDRQVRDPGQLRGAVRRQPPPRARPAGQPTTRAAQVGWWTASSTTPTPIVPRSLR
jgi:hypothetical protein